MPAGGAGQELGDDVEQITRALATAGARVPGEVTAAAREDLAQVTQRLALGVDYTVVALVGGTGSGKSSLFNALSSLQFADVGVIRPTTSQAAACIWGSKATALLDFLQVAPDRRIQRESALDGDAEEELTGLVLLDLPDHDSVESTHAEQVNRLLPLIDLLIWVVDPQKYADNVLHEEYLRALAARHEAMVVVINQIDTIPESTHDQVRDDVARLLVEDGLADVQIEMVSARTGEGVDRLRSLLGEVIAGESVAARTARDEVAAVRRRLAGHVGAQDPEPPEAAAVAEDLATASGVPSVAESVRRAVAAPRTVALAEVQRPASSRTAAIRDRWLSQATAGLPAPWREAVVDAAAEEAAFDDHVWTALHSQDLPGGTDRVAAAQRLVGLAAGALGLVLLIVGAALFSSSTSAGGSLAGAGAALLLACLVLVLVARRRRRRTAEERAEDYLRRTTAALTSVVSEDLVGPAQGPLGEHRSARAGICGDTALSTPRG